MRLHAYGPTLAQIIYGSRYTGLLNWAISRVAVLCKGKVDYTVYKYKLQQNHALRSQWRKEWSAQIKIIVVQSRKIVS